MSERVTTDWREFLTHFPDLDDMIGRILDGRLNVKEITITTDDTIFTLKDFAPI